ncbi:MAG: hypothetical protein R3320_09220 [Nitriliruptorales bacterium]|nr:hypothetical protein [Nitriliruptorales bacterium]
MKTKHRVQLLLVVVLLATGCGTAPSVLTSADQGAEAGLPSPSQRHLDGLVARAVAPAKPQVRAKDRGDGEGLSHCRSISTFSTLIAAGSKGEPTPEEALAAWSKRTGLTVGPEAQLIEVRDNHVEWAISDGEGRWLRTVTMSDFGNGWLVTGGSRCS